MKLILTGPESTGKTTLALLLSRHFAAPLVLEYSRQYLAQKQLDYDFIDLVEMCKMQELRITQAYSGKRIVVDTDWLSIYIWALWRFEREDLRALIPSLPDPSRRYLLCSPDLPWRYDPLRQNKSDREALFGLFIKVLNEYRLNYYIISGSPKLRLSRAIYYAGL